MPKIAIKNTTLILACKGPWKWQVGRELEITVPGAGLSLAHSGSTALLPADLLKTITSEIPGQAYIHSTAAATPGKVASVDAAVDHGSLAEKITVGGEPVATDATTGTFMIVAGTPSAEGNGVTDPKMIHSGLWKVKKTPQNGLTVCKGGGGAAEAETIEAPASAALGSAKTAPPVDDDATEAREGGKAYPVALELRLGDDSFFDVWGPESSGGLSLDIGAAQPGSDGTGLACRFRKKVFWYQLLAPVDRTVTVLLSPAELDPDRPIWLNIRGRPFGEKTELHEKAVGQVALFTIAGSQETVVQPERLTGFTAPDGYLDIWATPNTADGEGEEGAATALLRIAPERLGENVDGWVRIEEAPGPPAPWTKLYRPIAHELALVKGTEEGQVSRLEPLCVELTPLRPRLLAAAAVAERLHPMLTDLSDMVGKGGPTTTLAIKLEQYRERGGRIRDAVDAGTPKLHSPNAIFSESEHKRSRGLVDARYWILPSPWPVSVPGITPARLFLMRHFAGMRERGFALRDEAERLFELLDQRICADTPQDIAAEQRRARLFLGPLALERKGATAGNGGAEMDPAIDVARVISPDWDADDSVTMKEIDWLLNITRALAPDWDCLDRVTMTAAHCLQTLSRIEDHCRGVAALGWPGFERGGGDPLLDTATRERWTRIIAERLEEDERAMLEEQFRKLEALPALYQIREKSPQVSRLIKKAKRSVTLLRRLRTAGQEFGRTAEIRISDIQRNIKTLTAIRISDIQRNFEILTFDVLRQKKIRKAMREVLNARGEYVAFFWAGGKGRPMFVEKFVHQIVTERKVTRPKYPLLDQLKKVGDQHKEVIGKLGKGIDGVFAFLCVVNLLHGILTEEGHDRFEDKAQMLGDVLTLSEAGLRSSLLKRISILKKVKVEKWLLRMIVVVQCVISLARGYRALRGGRGKDAAIEFLMVPLLLLTLPRVLLLLGITGIAVPIVIGTAILAMFTLPFLRSLPEAEDIKNCTKRLTDHITTCVFGKDGFKTLGADQPRPHRRQIGLAGEFPGEPSKEEIAWLARVETELCDPDRNAEELDRIMAAAVALDIEFKTAFLSIGKCLSDPDWLDWFGHAGQAAGYRVTVPVVAFLGGSERVFFQRDAKSDYGISIWLEHSTSDGTIDVVVQTGGREDDLCYAAGDIGLWLVERGKDSAGRAPPLTLLLVVGAHSPRASARLTLPDPENTESSMTLRSFDFLILPDHRILKPAKLGQSAKVMLPSRDDKQDYERQPSGEVEKIMLGIHDDRRTLYWKAD